MISIDEQGADNMTGTYSLVVAEDDPEVGFGLCSLLQQAGQGRMRGRL